jgi:hypothetical protein
MAMETGQALVSKRSTQVLYEINIAKQNMVASVFKLGELLLEARDHEYHKDWGFAQFKDWIDSSDLDMGWRQAYYLMNIMEQAKEMGYTHEDLAKIKLSKLKEIFSLKDPEQIKQLMSKGADMSLEEVREAVKPERDYTYMNLRLSKAQKEIIMEAIERARQINGSVITDNGDVVDITEGRALELICGDFLSGVKEEFRHLTDELAVAVEGESGATEQDKATTKSL